MEAPCLRPFQTLSFIHPYLVVLSCILYNKIIIVKCRNFLSYLTHYTLEPQVGVETEEGHYTGKNMYTCCRECWSFSMLMK